MKTNSTKIKLTLALCFMLILPLGLLAFAPPPDPSLYVCGNGSVSLKYTANGYTLVNLDKVIWQKVTVDAGGVITPVGGSAAVTKIYDGTAASTDLLLAGDDIPTGNNYWVAHVITATPNCTGDVSAPVNVYKLSDFAVSVSPTSAAYCAEGATGATPSIITSTVTPVDALPTGVSFKYDWAGSTAGAGAVDAGDKTKFNMSATTAADYTVTLKITYEVTNGKTLKSPSNAACLKSADATVKVTAKPSPPTITVE